MFRFWIIAAAAFSALELIRRRYVKHSSPPKLDGVSTDWLAHARTRPDDAP